MRPDEGLSDTLHVYPTAQKAADVLRARARRTPCLLGHRVTTFPQLTDALARDLGIAVRVLEPELAAVVLARALDRPGLPEAWRGPQRGVLAEMLRVLGELEAAYLAPSDVRAVAAALPAGATATRLADLARVYAAYAAELDRLGAVDRPGRDRLVAEALLARPDARPRTLDGVRKLVFAEIYDFSILQFLIATSLIGRVGDAELVAFAHPENVDATRFLDRTWNRFVGDAEIADQVLPSFVRREGRRGNVAAVLRGVFARDRPPPEAPDGSIHLVVAPSRYREVEEAVRDVRRRLERGDTPAERIAILARDPGLYAELIEDVCRRYRVPVYFRHGRPLLASGLVRTCLNLLDCIAEGFPRARLIELLESDYLARTDRRLVRSLVESEFVSQRARPLADCIANAMARRAERTETADRSPADEVARTRERVRLERAGADLERLLATLGRLDRRRSMAGHARGLRRLLGRLGLRPARADVAPAAARRDGRAAERLDRTLLMLGGLAAALDLGPMPLADFGRLLATALASQEMDEPVPVTGSVRALGVLDARGLDFDVVYLLGLDDGTFPAPRRESPLLPDAMRREASRAAADVVRRKLGPRGEGLPLAGLLRTAREASLEDPFLFFLALSMAEREIVLSYPALNEQGNPTEPSPFLGEVAACLSEPLPERRVAASTVVPVATDAAEPAELVARAALDRWARDPHAPPDRLAAALAAALPGGEARIAAIDRRARIEERRSRWFLTAHDDPRKAALADAFVGRLERDPGPLPARVAAMTWSPTRLVELASCGFRFFAARILGLKPTEEAELGVVAREQGTLMHAVLRDFFTAHPTLPAGVDEALALGRAFVARLRAGAPPATIGAKDSALLDVAWEQMAVAVDEAIVLEHAAAGARPPGATVERLLEEPLAWTVAVPGGALGFEGRPDWIEVVREGGAVRSVRVLDYKASRSRTQYPPRLKLDRDLLVTGFQVPVYLLAALDRLGAAAGDAELAGGYLLPLANERPLVVEAFTRTDLAAVVGRIETLVAGAARGRFDVDPADCDQYCPYRAVCRYQPPPLEEDAGGD